MRALAMGFMVAVVAACAGPGPRYGMSAGTARPPGQQRAAIGVAADTDGPTVARHLTERYWENFASCTKYAGDPNPLPAVLCSGILMRATRRGGGYYVWNPNPSSPTPYGVSFSWLRVDSAYNGLVYDLTNGFVILPHFYADAPSDGYTQLTALCVYPFDGATNNRTGDRRDGCGAYPGIADSRPCQDIGVQDETAWLQRFANRGMYGNQCGFRITPGTPNAWRAFYAQSVIRQRLPAWFALHNEVMVGTWGQGDRRIPLEAFFYVAGKTVGLAEARANQQEFRSQTGRWVPVIRMTLPTVGGGGALFVYNPGDQAVLK
ncbi:hypothetical protein [Luteibacter yeojuensis]|uniref:Halovibrin HvnC n=1 Tax=Luteibacter yeojuensis TaxID=345309 RepID=A0A7X5TP79_9GAMM|nr:hypothetical protein [Luteibacter yeojuensis]NID15196.1 hypothetical protein [Luteibacter yeojuensis]